jgi:hypothetical protein
VEVELGADPYALDPLRDASLIVHGDKPCNAELPESKVLLHLFIASLSQFIHGFVNLFSRF